ncbi:MAG: hypothetical protein M0R76_13285 [Proteobacteria bacterium]|nr:hypothetical protein [Pseudomonadota bacterium]
MNRIRVCLWATTMQGNMFSLARHLQQRPEYDVVAVMQTPDFYRQEPINQLAPLRVTVMDRQHPQTLGALQRWKPHITVIDNHHPPVPLSPLLVNVWHGYSWKGPEDKKQFAEIYKSVKAHTGIAPDAPNPRFMWIAAGEPNRRYRIEVSGFHPDNVLALGQCYNDDIISPPFSKTDALAHYPKRFRDGPIFLLAPTWHHGTIFAQWGDDLDIIEALIGELKKNGAALVLRMHDRHRFDAAYVQRLENMCRDQDSAVLLKFKDTTQDNLLDIALADGLLSNYSSFLTFFYPTLRPTIHICPNLDNTRAYSYRIWKRGKVREIKTKDMGHAWAMPPTEHGGLMADNPDDLLAHVRRAIAEPDCCRASAQRFLDAHCAPNDGHRCEALRRAMEERLRLLAPSNDDFP